MNLTDIIGIALIVLNGFLFYYQQNVISTFKSKIEVLEKFQSIFNLDDVEKYVDIHKKNHEEEIRKVKIERIGTATKAIIHEAVSKLPIDQTEKYTETLTFTFEILAQLDSNARENFLLKLEKNEVILRDLLVGYDSFAQAQSRNL